MLRLIGNIFKAVTIAVLVAVVGILAFVYLFEDYNAYVVRSDSMQPTIKSGDMVFVGSPGSLLVGDVAPGTIITFQRNNEMVTHRIQSIEGDTVYTKGDALEETDPWAVSRFFDIEGCYMFHIPYVGLISSFIKTRLGWFVCVIVPAMCLVGFIVKDIVKEARRCFI